MKLPSRYLVPCGECKDGKIPNPRFKPISESRIGTYPIEEPDMPCPKCKGRRVVVTPDGVELLDFIRYAERERL